MNLQMLEYIDIISSKFDIDWCRDESYEERMHTYRETDFQLYYCLDRPG